MAANNLRDWKRLCDFIKSEIMGYDEDLSLSIEQVTAIEKTYAYLKIENNEITLKDMYMLLKDCLIKIYYCNEKMDYKSDLHKLNTAMKIAKTEYQTFESNREKQLMKDSNKNIVIPVIEDNDLYSDIERSLFKKCDYDNETEEIVKMSLVSAFLEGKISIDGLNVDE